MAQENNLELTVKQLLLEGKMRSQYEFMYTLAELGFCGVSQSRISRMLTRLGAVRSRNNAGNSVYCLTQNVAAPSLENSIEHLIVTCDYNPFLVVLKTQSGGADVVARLLDTLRDSLQISGAIASDDTVFVTPSKGQSTERLCQLIGNIF